MPEESDPLQSLIADILDAEFRGEPVNRESFVNQHPQHADSLREFFANHDSMKADSHTEDMTLPPASSGPGEDATLPPSKNRMDDATLPPRGEESTLRSAATAGQPSSSVGDRIRYFGDYELLEEIARGGMGVVYKARQINLNRIVALKMILAGQLAGEEDVKRFYTEAEAAASLDHPGIVPIFEVGEHQGQHYFSMGFIEGQSLAQKVADGPLPPSEAAELVKKICEAMAYAHQRGVIHRDLKPANILIDRNAQPKVTDFGLAKQMNVDSGLTGTGQILGTPSYMAPEQASGKVDQVGPLADVYALGAMLYCLLTGRPPFQAANPMDTLLQVLEKEPNSLRQLNSAVPVDLETICLKCLDKDAAKRYGGAEELRQEVDRFLSGRPITARPVTRAERTWRWCKRNPAVAALAATAVSVLIIGTVVSAYFAYDAHAKAKAALEAQQSADAKALEALQQTGIALQALASEREAKAQARGAIDQYVKLVTNDEILREQELQPLRRRLLHDAEKFYQTHIDQASKSGVIDPQLAVTFFQLGKIHLSSGSVEAARETNQQAIEYLKQAVEQTPDDATVKDDLANAHNLQGRILLEMALSEEGMENYRKALRLRQDLVERFPDNLDYLFGLGSDYNNLGELQRRTRDISGAEKSYRKAIEFKQRLVELKPQNSDYLNSLGNSYNNLGLLQLSYLRRPDVALESWKQAKDIRGKLFKTEPGNLLYRTNLGMSHFNLGVLYENHFDDNQRAIGEYDIAISLYDKAVQLNPHDVTYRYTFAKALMNSGRVQHVLANRDDAKLRLERSITNHQKLIADQPSVVEYYFGLAQCYQQLGELYEANEEYSAAETELTRARDVFQKLVADHPDDPTFQKTLAFCLYDLGDLLNKAGNTESALGYWHAESTRWQALLDEHPEFENVNLYSGGNLNNIAMLQEDAGLWAEAAGNYELAVRCQLAALEAEPNHKIAAKFLSKHYAGLSRTRRLLGDFHAAELAATEIANRWPDDPNALLQASSLLASCYEALVSKEELQGQTGTKNALREKTLRLLREAIAKGLEDPERLNDEPAFDIFRSDKAFKSLHQSLSRIAD